MTEAVAARAGARPSIAAEGNANNFSVAYDNAIVAGAPQAQLVEASKPKKVKGITPEAMARMERELARLQEGMA